MMTKSFEPPRRTLMGPGPSDVSHRVLAAMARPTIGHLDPEFVRMMDELKAMLQYAFRTRNALTIPISAPGSAGMETCFANLVEPGDKVIVCVNGVFGGRMKENVRRCGGEAIAVDDAWGTPVDPNKVEEALRKHPDAKVLAFVHAETSTGARSDARTLCRLAQEYDCLSIVDAVTSLGGIELEVDGWGADAVYSGTQKCLSCPPGIAPVTMSGRAVERIRKRNAPVQSWFLDLNLVMAYWGGDGARVYHHTAPVNALYGLHEALVMLEEEGLEHAWNRHARHHAALRAGILALGLRFVVDEQWRLPQLNAIAVPDGVAEADVRRTLLNDFDIEIGAGLGALAGKVWRIGLMGTSACRRNVLFFLSAMESVLGRSGAVSAAQAAYSSR
jgi:alanine-glyoxylate transaminase / serine-glyoxylate transaminase / serine-pyruvate transaminase